MSGYLFHRLVRIWMNFSPCTLTIRGENNAQHFEIQLIFPRILLCHQNYPNDIKIYSWLPIFCNDRACMWFGIGLKNVALVRFCLQNSRFLFALCFFKSVAWNGLWNPISLSDKSDKCWENKITIYARTYTKQNPIPKTNLYKLWNKEVKSK